jgi:hypothetical protein
MVEDEAVDARIFQQRLQPGQTDGVIGTQQLLHVCDANKTMMDGR